MNILKKGFLVFFIFFPVFRTVSSNELSLNLIYQQTGVSEEESYSAEMYLLSPKDSEEIFEGKIFFKAGHIRVEKNVSGMEFVTISRKDGVLFSFNPSVNSWSKTSIESILDMQSLPKYKETGEVILAGETFRKFESKEEGSDLESAVFFKEGIIHRIESRVFQNQRIILFKNIRKQELEDSLFLPPPDVSVQDMDSMMDMESLVEQVE